MIWCLGLLLYNSARRKYWGKIKQECQKMLFVEAGWWTEIHYTIFSTFCKLKNLW